jgi:hypothetical protein
MPDWRLTRVCDNIHTLFVLTFQYEFIHDVRCGLNASLLRVSSAAPREAMPNVLTDNSKITSALTRIYVTDPIYTCHMVLTKTL